MTLIKLLSEINTAPELIEFDTVISVIDSEYEFTPTEFANGELINQAGENSGS